MKQKEARHITSIKARLSFISMALKKRRRDDARRELGFLIAEAHVLLEELGDVSPEIIKERMQSYITTK